MSYPKLVAPAPALLVALAAALAFAPTAAAVDGTWFQYTPLSRHSHGAVYDSARQRMLVLGGHATTPIDDIQALSLSGPLVWTRLDAPLSLLPDMSGLSAAYDADNDRIVAVRMSGGSPRVLAFSTSTPTVWSAPAVSGTPPSTRNSSSWVLDPVGKRILFFGGLTGPSPIYLAEVWALNLSPTLSWQQILPAGAAPGGRYGAALSFDVARNRLVIFGGYGHPDDPFAPTQNLDDTWTLSFAPAPQWTRVTPGGTVPAAGTAKGLFDGSRDRMLVFRDAGGVSSLRFSPSPSWTGMGSSPVDNPRGATVILDPAGDRVVAFGGNHAPTTANTWILDLANDHWTSHLFGAPTPGGSLSAVLVFDRPRDRVLLLGQPAAPMNPWAFSPATATWSMLPVSGGSPSLELGIFACYDPYGDRLIAYGHSGSTTQLWALSLAGPVTWTQLPLAGAARPPVNRSLTYDPLRNRMIGYYGSLGTWILDLDQPPEWVNVVTSGTPPPIATGNSFAAAQDVLHDDWVVTGGDKGGSFGQNGAWALDLETLAWTTLTPLGTAPIECGQSLVFDPVGARAVTFGGALSGLSESNATYALALGATPSWSSLAPLGRPPRARRSHAVAYDPVRNHLLAFGGTDDAGNAFADLWSLRWEAGVADVPTPSPRGLALARAGADPGAELSFRVSLPEGEAGRLEVFDVAGRRVFSRDLASLGSGSRVVRVEGVAILPGIYVVRLSAAAGSRSARAIVIR